MNAPADLRNAAANDDELPRRTVIATMAGVMAAMLLGALDNTIVGTAMPRVIAELHGFEHYAAVTTAYMLSSTIVVPIAGKLSDIYGRKIFLLLGVAVFIVGSMLCGASQSMVQLVAFRAIQGIGAGCSQAMAFTTIADLFPPARRGRISGLMGAVFGVSSVIGPAIGGFLTDGPGWRWCFWINLPIGAAAFLVLLLAFPNRQRSREKPSIDYAGAFTLVCATVPILLALSSGGRDWAWDSPEILAMLGGGVVMTAVFIAVEMRAKAPIIPPKLLGDRVVAAAAVGAMFVGIGMFGALLFIPLFLQGVVGTSATRSGSVMAPMMGAMLTASITSGQIISRVGRYKKIAVVGVVIVTAGLVLLSTMNESTTYRGVLLRMIFMGAGLGITMPVFNLAVQNTVDPRDVGVATSTLQFLRSIGGSVGAAVFGALMAARFKTALHEALPADVASRLPPQLLAQSENPQMLMNPKAQEALHNGAVGPVLDPLLASLRTALATSTRFVFFVGACVVGVGVIATLLLKDVPLRKTNRPREPAPIE